MSVTLDTSAAYDSTGGVSSFTQSHTIGGTAKLLLVAVESQKNPTVTSVTWNGTAMSLIGSVGNVAAGTGRQVYVFGLANPATGTHDIVTTLSSAFAHALDVSSWNSTATSLTWGTAVTAVATSGTSSSIATGSLFPFVSWLGIRQTGGTITPGFTSLTATHNSEGTGSNQQFRAQYQSSGANATWSWTSSDNNVTIGVPLVESSTVAGWPVKVKQSGVFVNARLRLRQAGAWVTPTNVSAYYPGTGGATTEQRLNMPWDVNVDYAGTKPVFAHYVPWYPISLNNKLAKALGGTGDYYDSPYGKPGAVEAATDHRVYGGLVRDRPVPRPVIASGYEAADMYTDIDNAAKMKIDGFFVDFPSVTSTSWGWLSIQRLFSASDAYYAATGKRIWIMPMPDGNGGATRQVMQAGSTTLVDVVASANKLADNYGTWLAQPALWRYSPDVLTIPVFGPDIWGGKANAVSDRATFWSTFKSRMLATYGTTVHLWFCYSTDWINATGGAGSTVGAQAWGLSRWGDRDSVSTAAANNNNQNAPAYSHSQYSKPWMHFVAPGDSRPNDTYIAGSYRWWEQRGSRTFENCWTAAINAGANCEAVQLTTYNDYAESAHVGPSLNHGWVWADLNTYWMHRYKTGSYPTIVRDGVYLIHRIHPASGVTFTGSQTRFHTIAGSTAAADEVEVLVFATASATVELLVNGSVTQTSAVVAGMNRFNWTLPSSGVVSARLTRAAAVVAGTTATSSVTLGVSQVADDMHPRAFSSLRQSTGT